MIAGCSLKNTPAAYIEMNSGDRLPCTVLAFESADGPFDWESLPPHFVVAPTIDVSPPHSDAHTSLRVVRRFIRRIVWQPRHGGDDYRPGTLFLRDGRTVKFRTVRFTASSVKVLREKGQQEVSFQEIAELHLPRQDPWSSYFDELASLSPTGESRLLQIDSTDGLIATGSQMHFTIASQGNANDSDNWYHGVQPAWCLDTLWTRNSKIWMRRCWPVEQAPLTHILPVESLSRSLLASGERAWQRDKNTRGRPLQSAGQNHGWGYGVHAYSELHFPLPDIATNFRSRVGLDDVVGRGGCVRARVHAGSQESAPLYQSPYIVGSQQSHDTQHINLSSLPASGRRLILQVNPAHQGRPARADPFDIRDVADWLDPVVTLDREKLLSEIASRVPNRMSAFDGWTVAQHPDGDYRWTSDFRRYDHPRPGNFCSQVHARNEPLIVSRKVTVRPRDQWLMVSAYRQRGNPPQPELLIRIDGIDVAESPIPLRTGPSIPAPLAVSLAPYVGHTINLEVVQRKSVDPGLPPVVWHGLKICEHLPTLYRALEDDARLAAFDGAGGAEATFVGNDHHSGTRSLAIDRRGKCRINFPEPVQVRSNPNFGQRRFLRFATRKHGLGTFRIELLHADSRNAPAIYDAGIPTPSDEDFREEIWVDDQLPGDATVDGTEAAESFRWMNKTSGPVHSGELAIHRRARGMQRQLFTTSQALRVRAGDRLFAWVHCDAKTPPRALMLQFLTQDGRWVRAYWGENVISLGKDGTPERRRMGDLPVLGEWVRLEVPIESLEIGDNTQITGCAMTQFDGAVWWDTCGRRSPRDGPLHPAKSVWQLELPNEWIVTTRDVYSDFGELDVTGLVLHVPDGERGLFDHVYFARAAADFQLLPAAPSPEVTNQQARRELSKAVLEKGHPATVAILIDGRQATGVLVGGDGYVLTAGHVFGATNRDCEVQLVTGQRLPAKTRGICRSIDLGVIQITDRMDIPLPGLELDEAKDFPSDQLYVGFALEKFTEETPGATVHIVGIQRDFRETLWSDFHLDRATTGGPLLNREGRIIGTQIRDSRFGGFLYAKSFVARQNWQRMLQGEAWGEWFPGSGPMFGIDITNTRRGAEVSKVHVDSPAQQAGVAVGDVLTSIDGKPITSLDDVYRALAAKDPGVTVTAKFTRGGDMLSKQIQLMPRVP